MVALLSLRFSQFLCTEMLQESTVPQLARPDLQAMLAELQKSGRAEERKKSLSFSLLPIEEPSKKKLKLSPSQPCAEDKVQICCIAPKCSLIFKHQIFSSCSSWSNLFFHSVLSSCHFNVSQGDLFMLFYKLWLVDWPRLRAVSLKLHCTEFLHHSLQSLQLFGKTESSSLTTKIIWDWEVVSSSGNWACEWRGGGRWACGRLYWDERACENYLAIHATKKTINQGMLQGVKETNQSVTEEWGSVCFLEKLVFWSQFPHILLAQSRHLENFVWNGTLPWILGYFLAACRTPPQSEGFCQERAKFGNLIKPSGIVTVAKSSFVLDTLPSSGQHQPSFPILSYHNMICIDMFRILFTILSKAW